MHLTHQTPAAAHKESPLAPLVAAYEVSELLAALANEVEVTRVLSRVQVHHTYSSAYVPM